MERHEKQFSEVALSARKSNASVDKQKETSHPPTVSEVNKEQSRTTWQTGNSIISHKQYQKASVQCFQCKKLGHYARDCPLNNSKMEAHGQSSAKSAVLTATPVETESALSSLSIEQLEEQLAQRKLSTEVSQMQSASTDSAEVRVVYIPTGIYIYPHRNIYISPQEYIYISPQEYIYIPTGIHISHRNIYIPTGIYISPQEYIAISLQEDISPTE